jgi:hypothetical protein
MPLPWRQAECGAAPAIRSDAPGNRIDQGDHGHDGDDGCENEFEAALAQPPSQADLTMSHNRLPDRFAAPKARPG